MCQHNNPTALRQFTKCLSHSIRYGKPFIVIDDPYVDIYTWKACRLFGVFKIDVTPAMHKFAKKVYHKQMSTLYNQMCDRSIGRMLHGEF